MNNVSVPFIEVFNVKALPQSGKGPTHSFAIKINFPGGGSSKMHSGRIFVNSTTGERFASPNSFKTSKGDGHCPGQYWDQAARDYITQLVVAEIDAGRVLAASNAA